MSHLDYSLIDAQKESFSETVSAFDATQDSDNCSERIESSSTSSNSASRIYNSIAEIAHVSETSKVESSRVGAWMNCLGLYETDPQKPPDSRPNQTLDNRHLPKDKKSIIDTKILDGNSDAHGFLLVNDQPPHKDEAQVMLDVKRSFTLVCQDNSFNSVSHSSYTTIFTAEDIETLRKRLFCLIIRILRKYPSLHYYQGFHDIASVVLLTCNDSDETAFRLMEKLTVNHLRDFMIKDISLTVNHLRLIPVIIEASEPDLFELLKYTNGTFNATDGTYYDYKFLPPLSSILTFYSHDLTCASLLIPIWDFILGHGSVLASLYVYAAIMKHKKTSIFETLGLYHDFDFESIDIDLAHSLLSPVALFSDIDEAAIGRILEEAAVLMQNYVLEELANSSLTYKVWFEKFNKESVIMTSSRLTRIPYSQRSVSPLQSPDTLNSIVLIQEEQQSAESLHEADLLEDAFGRLESLSTSVNSEFNEDDRSRSSIVSSLMSLKAAPSNFNDTLINSTSKLYKKMMHGNENKNQGEDNPKLYPTISLYKLSLTIGFVSFAIHFFLKQTEFGTMLKILSKNAFRIVGQHIPPLGNTAWGEFFNRMCLAVTHAQDSKPVRDLAEITQVGLGSVKRSVYISGLFQ